MGWLRTVAALAALTILDTPEARDALIKLMTVAGRETVDGIEREVSSAETRYGAFRALWTMDKRDECLASENMNDEFKLHVIDAEGDPMVHLTRFRVPEVVLFGADQKLQTPISLTAGRHIMITAPSGSETVTVSRFDVHDEDQQIVTTTSVADIIRAVGKLKAAYPDVAQMLVQAEKQSNLPGRLEIDALPESGRTYYRMAAVAPGDHKPARQEVMVGSPGAVPNMFPAVTPRKKQGAAASTDHSAADGSDRGQASVVDVSDEPDEKKSSRRRGFLGLFRPANDSQ